jgi:hydroxymethylbilane synthase
MLPAVGQGALCIEIREDDPEAARLTAPLDHPVTHAAIRAERAFLRKLGGSCQVPMAAYGAIDKDTLTLQGLVASLKGTGIVRDTVSGPAGDPERLGVLLANRLTDNGADAILNEILSETVCYDKR